MTSFLPNLKRLDGFRSEACRAWRHALIRHYAAVSIADFFGILSIGSPATLFRIAGYGIRIRMLLRITTLGKRLMH